ncbi:MAG: pitrilysin family protein [Thermodesulfobacteriota bacterium]
MQRLLLALLFVPLLSLMVDMKTATAENLAPHLHKLALANGMHLIVKEMPGAKAATVQIWVKAGSVYEAENEAGITHFIEHMIFKGTPTRGAGEIAGAIEAVGGRVNAYTSYDYTVYHATLASRHWQLAMDVLADAVLHSTFDPAELEREKKVVLEEIGMRNDRPNVKLFERLMATAYTVHPYRLPVIGTAASVSSFSRDDILRYIERHYRPENLTAVVVGDVLAEEVMAETERLFGGLAAKPAEERALPREPEQNGPRFFRIEDDMNQYQLAIAMPVSSFDNPDAPVLDVIAGILGGGESARLYHQLRDKKGLVYRIDASSFTPKDPGLMEVLASVDGRTWKQAAEAVLEEFFKLKYLPVEEEELTRVKRNVESDFIFNLERVEGQARVLGSFFFLTGDPRETAYLDRIRAVTREDVLRVAARYFAPDRISAGILVPAGSGETMTGEEFAAAIARADQAAQNAAPASLVAESYLPDVHRFTLANGMTLLVREDHTVPTVAVRAVFPGGLRGETLATNGAFAFISELLPKGTARLSAREMALKVADMAADISGFNGKNTFGLKADFLARFFDDGMALVRDVLRQPAFDKEEMEKIRPELLDQLNQQEDSLPAVAFRECNRLLFGGHPYGLNSVGSAEAIRAFTVADLKSLYEEHARPDRLVLAVAGDVKAGAVRDLVEKLFADWQVPRKEESAIATQELVPPVPDAPRSKNLVREKEQVHIIIAFLGTTLQSGDRYAMEVMDTILSGQSGRLFTELRDRQSLAYSLSSFSMLGLDTGSFGVYIGTSPDKKDAAIRALWAQLARMRNEPVAAAELTRAKNMLIGNYEMGLQTHSAQALEMALNETYGLGQNFGTSYIDRINGVTADEVMRAAERYLLLDHYVMVTAGAEPVAQMEQAASAAEGK